MARTHLFDRLARVARIARTADRHHLTPEQAAGELDAAAQKHLSRRSLLGGALAIGATSLVPWRVLGAPQLSTRVAVVGAGMAGLACADTLSKWGIEATVYEAHPHRVGGRVFTARDTFPGQVAENGGEFIDTGHKTMIAYARELGLPLENLERAPGASTFYFDGQHYTEDEVVAEYRILVARMRPDYQALSGGTTFYNHTEADRALDHTDLATYLDRRAGDLPLIRKVLTEAYKAEYGLETSQQSTLSMLYFLHLDRARKFREFGVFSDERYHVVGGNDAIAHGLAARLPRPVQYGARLTRLARRAGGEYELYFNNSPTPELADAVVSAIPFSVLRGVTLDASLGLSADKLRAINTLGYGNNAKTMIGFDRRIWAEQGRSGSIYSNLPHVQTTWETNYSVAGPTGILTDYSSGDRGLALQRNATGTFGCGGCHSGPATDGVLNPQGEGLIDSQASDFLRDLDRILPGALFAASRRPDGTLRVQRGHWTPQPFSRGSYTCYLPGQFTTVAGLEAEPAGGLKFAGEHTDSFYEWQGFMEGASNSGIAAAQAIVSDVKKGRLPG
jgi:monoamine oxidase